jgi:hypothetical protein
MPVSDNAITFSDEGVEIDATLAAEKLGLSPELFWQNMQKGRVYGLVERGESEDAGRVRITLRYRSRTWSTIVTPSTERAMGSGSPPLRPRE